MTLLAPERLILVLVPILLAAGYLLMQRRRTKFALRFTAVDLLDTVAPDRPGWRRHAPALAFLAAISLLVVGMARPAMAVETASKPTVILALDVSYSMDATDVLPNRITAARVAAKKFLDQVPAGTRVGLVAFSGSARALVVPTSDLDTVRAAIDRLKLGPGTAIGEAIYTGLEQLPRVTAATNGANGTNGAGATAGPTASGGLSSSGADTSGDQAAGSIVLLSDGKTTMGRADSGAARAAKARGVPVSTIAFGTANGRVTVDGQTVSVPVDTAALQAVATTTGGRSFQASSADQLTSIFQGLGQRVGVVREQREVTDYMIGAALVAAVAAAAGSLAWFSRLP
jgi:Ca-activated chloride channel family protein